MKGQARPVEGRALLRRVRSDPSTQLLLAQLVVAGTAFSVNVLAARALGASGRGDLALLLQVAYLATLALLLGVDRSLVTTYAGAGAGEGLRAAARLLRVPALVAGAAALLAALAPLPGPWRAGIAVVVVFALSNAALRALRAVAIASGRQLGYLLVVVTGQGALLASAAALLVAGVDQVLVWVAVYVVVTALPVAVCWRRLARPGRGPGPSGDGVGAHGIGADATAARIASARREGWALLPSSVAQAGTLRLDRLLLAALASSTSLGVYASVATMTELLTWPVQAWADSRLGRWRQAHREGRLRVGPAIALTALALVVGGAVLALAVRAALVPLLGPEYRSARSLVVPLVAAAALFALAQLVITALIARQRAGAASTVEVVGFVVSVAAYAVLIPRTGAMGAAHGSLIGYGTTLVAALGVLAADTAAPRRARRPAAQTRPDRPDRPACPTRPARAARSVHRVAPVRPALVAPVLALLVVAYAGRFTAGRTSVGALLPPALADLDVRVVALPLLAALVVHELRRRPARPPAATGAVSIAVPGAATPDAPAPDPSPLRAVPEGWLVAALLFLLYQVGSGLWAPPGARVGSTVLDVASIAALTVGTHLLARGDPRSTVRAVLWFLWAAGCLYALAALAAGPGDQGRFSAFGGGPNVFVRVQVLALVALAGLLAGGAPRRLVLSVPLLGVAALLSGSRGGLLAAVVVAAVVLVRCGPRVRRAALAAAGLLALGAVVAAVVLPSVADLLTGRFVEQTIEQGYPSQRPQIWGAALALALAHPLLGVGLDGFHATAGADLGVEYPHNVVLAVLAEGGLVGAAALGVAVALWAAAVRGRRLDPATATVVAATAYVAVASVFSGDYYDARLAWCFAALAAAAAGACPPRAPRRDRLVPVIDEGGRPTGPPPARGGPPDLVPTVGRSW